jgi:regulator of replication initiation timing
MVDLDAMDADPWPTWPVDKNELRGLVDEIERLRAKIQQLNDSAICINNDWSDAICENFDLREENAELREIAIAALKEGEKKDDAAT